VRERARALLRRVGRGLGVEAPPPQATPRDYYLAASELVRRHAGERSAPDDDLTAAELKVASQNGEDGVVAEILVRLGGPAHRHFVEFGVDTGAEGNCVFLADVLGWHGLFIEGGADGFARLEAKYRPTPVEARRALVTPGNVNDLLAEVPHEFDVLSIDVDGDDLWIWQALTFRPRLVVIEYNAALPSDQVLVQPPDTTPDGTDFFGASLAALVEVAREKGYRLVHCEQTGVNAFFVRDDLGGDWPGRVRPRGPNYHLEAHGHPPDPLGRSYLRSVRV
jgi:hypothetical protein